MASNPEDPFLSYFRMRIAERGDDPNVSPAEAMLIRRIIGSDLEGISAGGPQTEQDRRRAKGVAAGMFGAAFLDQALLSPAQGVTQLGRDLAPGRLKTPFEKFDETMTRLRGGMLTRIEENALEAGASPESIGRAHAVGGFFGLIAPIGASIKIASLILRSPVKLIKYPFAGSLVTDTAAGMVFGGAFEPAEDHGNRLWNMSRESAIFGTGRLVMGSLIPLKAWRDRRLLSQLTAEEITQVYRKVETGGKLTRKETRVLTGLLNEESFLSNSSAAQEIFERGLPETALIKAIIDQGSSRSSAGVVRSLSNDLPEINRIIEQARQELPHLKFDVVSKVVEGQKSYDVFFGLKGLNNKQRAQLKAEGRFDGQLVQHSHTGGIYEYVGRGTKPDRVRVRRAEDGKITQVREEFLTDLPNYMEPPGPELDALYRNFAKFFDDAANKMRQSRGGMTEADIIQGIRDGTLNLAELGNARRAFDLGGAIVYPEELGVQSLVKLVKPEEIAAVINQRGLASGARILEPPAYVSFEDVFNVWAKERGITDVVDFTAARTAFASRMRRDLWKSIPAEERALYDNILTEQLKLIDEGRIPVEAFANQKGFNLTTLADQSVVLREVNTGAKFIFQGSDEAAAFLRGIVRTEADLPMLIPPLRGGIGLYTGGFPDPGSAWRFDKMVSLEPVNIPRGNFRNLMNVLQDIEQMTDVPVWSQGFLQVDQGHTIMRSIYTPWAKKIEQLWGKTPLERQYAISDVWKEMQGSTTNEIAAALRKSGASPKEIRNFIETRAMLDTWFKETGLDASRYMEGYFSKIRPYVESMRSHDINQALRGFEVRPPDHQFWAEFTRTGDLATTERGIEVVLHKYIRSLLWKNHVQPHWDRLAKLTGTRWHEPLKFKDLAPNVQGNMLRRARQVDPQADLDSPVVPDAIRKILLEYLNSVRGTPHASQIALRDFTQHFMNKLGVKLDGRVGEELIHSLMSAQYGSLMGLRPWHVARNVTQVPWTMYPRLGNRHMASGLERALTRDGAAEVYNEGVLRLAEAGIPFADVIFKEVKNLPIDASNPLALPLKSAIWSLVRTGKLSRDVSQKFLQYYTAGDSLTRSWGYWWQKNHAAEWLTKFESGSIGWDKFVSESMAYYSPTVKQKFREFYRLEGRERALRFIGKQASDQNLFIYGGGVQPAWMQTWYGRLLGTFGTWPVWAIENFFTQPIKHASAAEIARFTARVGILGGIFSNIMVQTGFNLWSWFAPASVMWAGGPYLDMFERMRKVIGGPLDQKAGALKSIAQMAPRLMVPGYSFYLDVDQALDMADPNQAALSMFLGRPLEDPHWAVDVLYDPRMEQPSPRAPDILEWLEDDWSRPGGGGPLPLPLPLQGGEPGRESFRMNVPRIDLPGAGSLRPGVDLPQFGGMPREVESPEQ